MATYIIVKNILESSVNVDQIKKIDLHSESLMGIHGIVRNLYENKFFMRAVTPETITDRKKRKMARVTIFNNGNRMGIGVEYTLQNKKIDEKTITIDPVNDTHCPYCESDDIDWGESQIYVTVADQKARCNNCDCKWYNVYTFSAVKIQ